MQPGVMMQPGVIWLVGGGGLLVLEVLAPGVFMMWLGLAALGTGVLVLGFEVGLPGQVVGFAVFAAISLAAGLRLRGTKRTQVVNTAQSGLIGRSARVLQADGGTLRVRIGDSDWPARLARDVVAPAVGTELRVVGVDGLSVVLGPGNG